MLTIRTAALSFVGIVVTIDQALEQVNIQLLPHAANDAINFSRLHFSDGIHFCERSNQLDSDLHLLADMEFSRYLDSMLWSGGICATMDNVTTPMPCDP